MAADHFRGKNHDRSDRQKYMEHNFTCARGGPESIMKFSPQRIESPPPKPPRRRYSDQLTVPSLGTYSSNKKHNEEIFKSDPKLKRCSPKEAYLSLPANLTSNAFPECEDSSNLLSQPLSLSDQFTHSKENEFYVKYFLENLKFSDSSLKKTCSSNQFCYKEKLQSVSQGINSDHMFSKYQYDEPCTIDKVLKNSKGNKTLMTGKCINHNLKSVHKDCHRRHHSDPVISCYNLQKDSMIKLDWEQCCDKTSYSSMKINEYCDSLGNCSCCKKSYLIMQEIRILKDINEKLWQHLCALQSCLENMRKKVYDESADVSVSGLLSSIYYAQKAKDCAMEERMKIILEERDVALHELDDLINVLTQNGDYTDGEKEIDKDLKELLGEIGCTVSPSKLMKYQRKLLAQIHNLKSSKQECLSHEFKQVMIERDNALEKVRKLEEDVKDLKICYDLWHSDNKHWEINIFDMLNQVMHQRDAVLSKIDNGFDIGNVIYRLPVSNRLDSIDHQNVLPFESLKSHESIHLNDYKQQHSIGTSDEVRQLKEEVLLLNKALETERKKREQAEGKCVRLERLVHILRKKLNGQNVGVPV